MAATDPKSLLSASSCYACYSAGEQTLMIIALLRLIVLNGSPMAATDPKSLLSQASCYACYGGGGLWTLMIEVLLSQIASGSAGGVCITGGTLAPTGTPPCNFAVYIQQPGPNFGLWLGDTVFGWSQLIAQGP